MSRPRLFILDYQRTTLFLQKASRGLAHNTVTGRSHRLNFWRRVSSRRASLTGDHLVAVDTRQGAMSAPPSSDYELLTEHLSYPPVALLDDIINTVNVLSDRAIDSVERLLLSIPPQKLGFSSNTSKKSKDKDNAAADLSPEEAAKLEIENGTHQLETLLNASIDKKFDLFELYVMRYILTVRPEHQPYMRLAHYDGLDLAPGPQPDRPTAGSVTALRRRLQASQKLHVALEAERARNDALLRRLRGVLGIRDGDVKTEEDGTQPSPFGFLRDKGNLEEGGTEQPITTTTEFTLSQLQALRSLSTSLRTILPDLGTEDTADAEGDDADDDGEQHADGKKSWRRERAEYIEASSRKYLERSGGLELGPRGEVRDGEWQGEGRGLTKGEVEGLEKVAALLESGSGRAKEGGGGGGSGGSGEGGSDAMDES
ncbi:Kinetochore-associated protein MTW1 [Tolypocladium ophioglossoides CBS 100239]|uniref:Kinetochore-associated protein MTW1 n=1 Tax=Tolypocladium ophioglossoides (strain CBS 100239) TaxID=1163406 RepID=A0A0L0NCE8_TOLOC|nr:Kinetochore-associated protein MTW1 [Tolypocladium ophioglossoides CBS 100239]